MGIAKRLWLVLTATLAFSLALPAQTEQTFKPEQGRGYRYLLYLPSGVEESEEKPPVILYLHGASCRGSDLNKLKRYGLPWHVDRHKDFPFIVISPQCPSGGAWDDPDALIALVDHVIASHNGDKDRVYLTGMSLGGAGVWATALAYPNRFAAIAPVCAPAPETRYGSMDVLSHVPTWIFHGTEDNIIPPSGSMAAAKSLRAVGGEPTLSLLEGRNHGIAEVFNRDDLYSWFLEHKRQPMLASRGGAIIRKTKKHAAPPKKHGV